MKHTWEERLAFYEEEIERMTFIVGSLKETQEIANYFKKAGKEKNMYLVEMRRIIAMELFNTTKLTKTDIAAILNKDHASVVTLMDTLPNAYCHEEVKENYKEWLKEGKVPYTFHKSVTFRKKDKTVTSTKAYLKLKDL